MFNRFEVFMNKWLMPIAQKVDKQCHLNVTKASMVITTPFAIPGSFFAIIPALPNMIGENSAFSQFILNSAELPNLPVTLSIGIMSVYVMMCTTYNLGNHYKLCIPGCATLSTFVFLFVAVEDVKGGISITNFGTKGLLCAMLAGMATMELYRFYEEKNLTVRMPKGMPDSVSKSFELVPMTIVTAGTLIAVRLFSQQTFGALSLQILTRSLAPLVGSMNNPWAVLFLHFMICLISLFGTHSSALEPITCPVVATLITKNIIARQVGEPPPHFYTAGTSSAFFGFTGAGVTVECVVACTLSKSKHYRKIRQIALFPSLFGINKPILPGVPIILNSVMFIPFVFGGAIANIMPVFLMRYGLLDKPFFDPPYVGASLEGLLTDGGWKVILVYGTQLILAALLYLPFFKIMERQELCEKEARAKKAREVKNIFSDDEGALLNNPDLDFQQ